jgi:hypothetical protein
VVRTAVEIVVAALLAENGALGTVHDRSLATSEQAARRVIDDAGRLVRAIDAYRGLIALAADAPDPGDDFFPDDDIPF